MDQKPQRTDVEPRCNRVLRLPQVREKTGLSRSGIYERIRNGGFPPPINLGGRTVGWLDAEVENWITQCVQNRNQEA